MQVSCLCGSAQMSFYEVNMFVCSDWSSQLISASRSMFQMSAFAISVNCDTSGAHCLQGLLQHSCTLSWRPVCNVCRGSKVCYQQTTTSVECGSVSGQWHEEIWPWSYAATTCRSSLAWTCCVQTLHDDVLMPGRHCSTVHDSILDSSLWDCIMTASSLGCQPPTDSSATPMCYIWWSGVCCRQSVDVELTAETFTWAF